MEDKFPSTYSRRRLTDSSPSFVLYTAPEGCAAQGPCDWENCWPARDSASLFRTISRPPIPNGRIWLPSGGSFPTGCGWFQIRWISPRSIRSADPSHIGLIGFSLGAYLSLALGSQQQRIKAIVDFFGGLSDYFIERLTQLAPVLILHGEADQVVPVSEAHKVAQALDQRGLPYEMKLYRNAGHGFQGLDMLDAAQRAYKFLKQHLGATAHGLRAG